jgi:hypothetical protein
MDLLQRTQFFARAQLLVVAVAQLAANGLPFAAVKFAFRDRSRAVNRTQFQPGFLLLVMGVAQPVAFDVPTTALERANLDG